MKLIEDVLKIRASYSRLWKIASHDLVRPKTSSLLTKWRWATMTRLG